jgi:hypothetical protein
MVSQDVYDRAHEAWQDHYDGENFEHSLRAAIEAAFAERAAELSSSAPAAASGHTAGDETGWLLERNNAKYYFAGVQEQHNGMGFCWFPCETQNHLEAIRFANKECAEKMKEQIGSFGYHYIAVEHAWIGGNIGAPAQPPSAVSEAIVADAVRIFDEREVKLGRTLAMRAALEAALSTPPGRDGVQAGKENSDG